MSNRAGKKQLVTIAEFDAFLERQGADARLYELISGEIVMMTNPTRRHERIVANVGTSLKLALDTRGCTTFFGGLRVQANDNSRGQEKPKPDILVRCGPSSPADDLLTYVTDPIVIVEVLSPSTMDYDRGDKLTFYKSLPTVRHIVIVYQDQVRIEHYRRTDETAEFERDVATSLTASLTLASVAFTLSAAEVYVGVEVG